MSAKCHHATSGSLDIATGFYTALVWQMPQRYAERWNIMLTLFRLKMVLSRKSEVLPMTHTHLRNTLGTVVTGIFLMTAGNATAMPQVMGGLDQSPKTIVQKVGGGDKLFKTQKNKHQSRREHGDSPKWNHAKRTPQRDNGGSAQTEAAPPAQDTQPVFEDFDAVTRGALINF
jgi:hypothetical protein